MRSILFMALAFVFLSGCVSSVKKIPAPPVAVNAKSGRDVASNYAYTLKTFNDYFTGNYYSRLNRINEVIKTLHANMPDQGSGRKKLLGQASAQINEIANELAKDRESAYEKAESWLPVNVSGEKLKEKVRLLGRAVETINTMHFLGIYLSATGVMSLDDEKEDYYYNDLSLSNKDFYYDLLDMATASLDSELKSNLLVYTPEMKHAETNNARLKYLKLLVNEVRGSLIKNNVVNPKLDSKRIDKVMLQLKDAVSLQDTVKISGTADYNYAKNALKEIHVANSGDIFGFENEVEMTLMSKFSFEMINELIANVRK